MVSFNDANTWVHYRPMKRSWISPIFWGICQAKAPSPEEKFGDEHMKMYGAYLRRNFVALGSIPRLRNAGPQLAFETEDAYKLVQFIRLQSVYNGKPCWHDYRNDEFEYRPTRDDVPTYAFPMGAGE